MRTSFLLSLLMISGLVGCPSNPEVPSPSTAVSPTSVASPKTTPKTTPTPATAIATPTPSSPIKEIPQSTQTPKSASGSQPPVQANADGDFARRTGHRTWMVIDPDPKGLSCRWSDKMPANWYAPDSGDRNPPMNVYDWPIVRTFPPGAALQANLTPAGFATLPDDRGKPWLKVSIGPNDQVCLIRANERFIKPL